MNGNRFNDMKQVVQSIWKSSHSAIIRVGKYVKKNYLNTVGKIMSCFSRSTLLGKTFIILGLIAAISVVYLSAKYAIDISIEKSEYILVTSTSANVREGNTTQTKIIEKVRNGDRLTRKGESKKWWYVQGDDWKKPGWISKKLAKLERKKELSVNYEMKGFGLAFLASLIMFFGGFCLRQN